MGTPGGAVTGDPAPPQASDDSPGLGARRADVPAEPVGPAVRGPGRPAAPPARAPEPARARRDRSEDASERFLRALVTHRGTQVSSEAAMRAREVGTPTARDLADADRDLVIERRYYTPPGDLPTGRSRAPRSGPRG